jgi:hypothetical protein
MKYYEVSVLRSRNGSYYGRWRFLGYVKAKNRIAALSHFLSHTSLNSIISYRRPIKGMSYYESNTALYAVTETSKGVQS